MDEDNELGGLFIVPEGPDHPAIIAERVLQMPEHAHLRDGEAHIEWLFRADPKIQAGRQILGTCHLPTVQGSLREFFVWMCARLFGALPDFLIILDHGYWMECGPRNREILVFHELSHAVQAVDKYGEPRFEKDTGRPVWAIKGHDVEEFTSVVARYGAWNDDIRSFIAAARDGGEF
jgi:hypothetical protein